MGLSLSEVNKAIRAALLANSTFVSLVTGLFDSQNVPDNQNMPYVASGETTITHFNTFGRKGQDITITLHTWSNYNGKKEVEAIQSAIFDVLDQHEDNLIMTGHTCVDCSFDNNYIQEDDTDGETLMHGVDRYHILTQENLL